MVYKLIFDLIITIYFSLLLLIQKNIYIYITWYIVILFIYNIRY